MIRSRLDSIRARLLAAAALWLTLALLGAWWIIGGVLERFVTERFDAEAAAIVEMCAGAGRPQDAAGHITAGRTRGQVAEALLNARALNQVETSPAHPTGEAAAAANPQDPHGWGASVARVYGAGTLAR